MIYCTGGIRCEKASAVMLNAGFEDVRQLDGGILAYLQEYGESHWNGDCFVFDQRVAVDHNLRESKVKCASNAENHCHKISSNPPTTSLESTVLTASQSDATSHPQQSLDGLLD